MKKSKIFVIYIYIYELTKKSGKNISFIQEYK